MEKHDSDIFQRQTTPEHSEFLKIYQYIFAISAHAMPSLEKYLV